MRKRNTVIVLGIVVLVILASFMMVSCSKNSRNAGQKETVYDRVIKAGKIRCGYVIHPPGSIKDPNTAKLSGIHVELMEAVGKNLGLKIEWTEEVGWGTMIEGLSADRYDLIASPVWPTSARGKLCDFSVPIFYSVLGAYVRADDNRFTNNLGSLNSETVKISTIDGEISDIVARAQFPKAQRVSLAELSGVSQALLAIPQKRADVAFVEPYIGNEFLRNNPGTIKNIAVDKPIRFYPNTMMFKQGEIRFKTMLNTAIEDLFSDGTLDALTSKYDPAGVLYHRAYPYRIPGE